MENQITTVNQNIDIKDSLFEKVMAIYNEAMDKVENIINSINEDLKKIYNYSTVDHTMKRIKSPQSILDKMKKKNYNLNYKELIENINDIAGVRVICPLRKDV